MTQDTDEKFFKRADAHIFLSNEHLADADRGRVSASMMFAASRFNAWVSAAGHENGAAMAKNRDEIIDYFANQYRAMLEENVDNYIAEFDRYMTVAAPT